MRSVICVLFSRQSSLDLFICECSDSSLHCFIFDSALSSCHNQDSAIFTIDNHRSRRLSAVRSQQQWGARSLMSSQRISSPLFSQLFCAIEAMKKLGFDGFDGRAVGLLIYMIIHHCTVAGREESSSHGDLSSSSSSYKRFVCLANWINCVWLLLLMKKKTLSSSLYFFYLINH